LARIFWGCASPGSLSSTPHVQQSLLEVSHESPATFGISLVRAIFAGWLIALMVWLLPAAEASRFSVIVLLTYLIGLGNFNHMVAGSNKIFFLIANQAESWNVYAHHLFLPTLLGNIIGGVSLVAFPNHAQVAAGKEV
jgi:formate-nitrite transporter family protein